MWFDGHWHARDEEQRAKETVAYSLVLAEAGGGTAIAAMPNLVRPLVNLERAREYLAIARNLSSPVQFYVHLGLTPDPEQVKKAVDALRKEPGIIGLKAYLGRSTGNLSIVREEEQAKVLETLVQEGFEGVLVGHFEDEEKMNDSAYDPFHPIAWSTLCRSESAEVSSFQTLSKKATELGFVKPEKLIVLK